MKGRYTLGIIGGSGLYELDGLTNVTELAIDTPFGKPSDVIVKGELGDATLLFLPRHARGHRIPPHMVNYRANVCALKLAGATHMLSVTAVGSMREEIAPGDMVTVDQYIDLTKRRHSTFFDEEIVAHVAFADPICPVMQKALTRATEVAVRGTASRVHSGGTYVCIEGPQFSTRAESLLYRSWGVSVIGMTAVQEAKLAREAELPCATLALATDYDCWHASEAEVNVEAVVATVKKNVATSKRAIAELSRALPAPETSPAAHALRGAIMTAPETITAQGRHKLDWLVGKYLNPSSPPTAS